jgi:Effector-associated domain 10/AAA domain
MANPSNFNDILQRILDGTQTDTDVEDLRQWLNSGGVQNLQVGKYNVNIGQGEGIHIGDRTYQGLDAEAIREVVRAVNQGSNAADIRSIVKSILKEEFPNLTPSEQPQNISCTSLLPNPFVPLTGRVEDPAQFFEPQGVVNNVFETLNSGSSVALIGERGMGKSSILKAIERLAPERLQRQAIYLDWNLIPNEDTFWEMVCHGIGVQRCYNHHLIRELQSRRILLLLDEVEKMGQQEFGSEIRSQLRGFAQGSSMKVVMATCVSLDILFADAHNSLLSPFAGLCMEEKIPRWSDRMMGNYIGQRLAGNPIQFTSTQIDRIVQASEGQPQQLVKDCHNLYRQYRDRHESR